jgi:hypothetical protein
MNCECGKPAEPGKTECFRCRVSSVGFSLRGPAIQGNRGFHTTKREWMEKHLGTSDDRVLAKQGIERADQHPTIDYMTRERKGIKP